MYTVVSGCSGYGGLDEGFKATGKFKTVCYIEREAYPQALLLQAMREGVLDISPIWSDFRTFDGKPWCGAVDCFIAGIPCQPHSMAGKRRGKEDDRNLWPYMQRIIREMEPRIVVVENVPGLFIGQKPYGLQIMGELQHMGYCVAGITLSAQEVGAPHRRNRRFIIGFMANTELCRRIYWQSEKHTTEGRQQTQPDSESGCFQDTFCDGCCGYTFKEGCNSDKEHHSGTTDDKVSNSEGTGLEGMRKAREQEPRPHAGEEVPMRCCALSNATSFRQHRGICNHGKDTEGLQEYQQEWTGERSKVTGCNEIRVRQASWKAEPPVCGVADGCSNWADRIKAGGNAVVPQVAQRIAEEILKVIE